MDFLSLDGVDTFDVFIQANIQSIVTISSYSDVTCGRFECFSCSSVTPSPLILTVELSFIFVYNAFVVTS